MPDEKGEAMSKTLGNVPPFDGAAVKMVADPMSWLYAASPDLPFRMRLSR
jgi:hypothetical protein